MCQLGRFVVFSSLVAIMLAVTTDEVVAQKKKGADTPQNAPATEADYGALKATLFPAKIVTLDAGKSVTIRVESSKKETNPNYKPPTTTPGTQGYNPAAAQLSKKLADLQRAATAKNSAQSQTRINQDIAAIQTQLAKLNNDPNNQPLMTVTLTKDYELTFEKKVVYRKMFLPIENDADGNPKKFSAEEKLAFRGTESPPLPGYIAKIDDVQEGQEVKLYLTLPKKKAKTNDDTAPPEHATVKMIVLTKRAPTGADADTPKKK